MTQYVRAMYRAPDPKKPPTTAWARHLDKVMRDNDWSRVQLFEVVGAELGYRAKSRTAMGPILWNKEPTPARAEALRKRFGEPPALTDDPLVGEPPDLATALLALAHELAEARREREEYRSRLSDLEAVCAELAARSTLPAAGPSGSPTSGVLQGSVG